MELIFFPLYFMALAFFLCLFFVPSIIAVKTNHPYKIPIVIVNVLGGWFLGVGWLVSLIWCFIKPEENEPAEKINVAPEIEKLFELKEKGILSQDEFDSKKRSLLET